MQKNKIKYRKDGWPAEQSACIIQQNLRTRPSSYSTFVLGQEITNGLG
uniref:Uncharacterized protein n=1 Tax=Rhizophora mucronata TaxID=61149 RepID=A0A2P2LDH7_RHIMU